jgi:hypothetical protein
MVDGSDFLSGNDSALRSCDLILVGGRAFPFPFPMNIREHSRNQSASSPSPPRFYTPKHLRKKKKKATSNQPPAAVQRQISISQNQLV